KNLRLHIGASVGNHLAVVAAGKLSQVILCLCVLDDGKKRRKHLIQARLDTSIYQLLSWHALVVVAKAEKQEFVAQGECLLFVTGRQVDRNILAKPLLAHLFGKTPAFQCPILKESSRGY